MCAFIPADPVSVLDVLLAVLLVDGCDDGLDLRVGLQPVLPALPTTPRHLVPERCCSY